MFKSKTVTVYSKPGCTSCTVCKNLLKRNGIKFNEVQDVEKLLSLGAKYNIVTAPIITIDNKVYSLSELNSIIKKIKKGEEVEL